MLYVVAEGPSDQKLIERLLRAAEIEGVEVLSRSGRSEAISLATSLRVIKNAPVVIALDSDTMDDARIREQEQIVSDLLKRGGGAVPFAVVFFKPEIESVFFAASDWLGRAIHHSFTEAELARAEAQPKFVLSKAKNGLDESALPDLIDDTTARRLLQHPAMQKLVGFANAFAPAVKV